MYTEKILHLSIDHLKKETVEAINDLSPFPIVFLDPSDEYGFVVRITESDFDEDGTMDDLEDLLECMRFAWENDCGYIRFDVCGPDMPELPTYKWEEE